MKYKSPIQVNESEMGGHLAAKVPDDIIIARLRWASTLCSWRNVARGNTHMVVGLIRRGLMERTDHNGLEPTILGWSILAETRDRDIPEYQWRR